MGGFNAAEYEQKPEYDNSPLPEGEYYLEIENAIVKQTANGKGTGCNVTFSVLGAVHDNAHKGRKLFAWFTLQHENEMAQSIGQREFHGLRLAIDKESAADTDEFIGANLVAAVGIDKKDAERNQIRAPQTLTSSLGRILSPLSASTKRTPSAIRSSVTRRLKGTRHQQQSQS